MVENTQNKISFVVGEGGGVYPFSVPFFDDSDIVCYLTKGDGAQDELLVAGRDYSVESKTDYSNGANITLKLTGLPDDSTLTVMRILSLRQTLNLPEFGKIPSTPVEQTFDKLVMIMQQFQEVLDRVITSSGVSGSQAGANFQKFFSEFMAQYMLTDSFADAVGKVVTVQLEDKNSLLSRRIAEVVDEIAKPYKYGLRKLFDVFYGFSNSSPLGAVDLSLGAVIDKWTYPEFYSEAIRRASLGAIPTVTEAEYLDSLNKYGECPAFFINQAAGTIRLPKIISAVVPGNPGQLIQPVRETVCRTLDKDEEETREITVEKRKVPLRLYIQVFSGVIYNDAQVEIDINSEDIINAVGLGVDQNE